MLHYCAVLLTETKTDTERTLMFLLIMATVCASISYASLIEWSLHRFMMHRPFLGFEYPYKAHALTHHRIFKADESYHLQREADKSTIPMAWWNAIALVPGATVLSLPISWVFNWWWFSLAVFPVCAAYYGTYEYLHWCMHLPKGRRVERTGLFFRLNGHHLLHHRYPNRNFNVVLPFADLVLGTLLVRSPVRFAQARGPSVPDVQPAA